MKLTRRDIFFILFSLGLFMYMAKPIQDLTTFTFRNSTGSHIVLVPFVSGFLIFLNRKNIFQNLRYDALPGTLVILVGVGLLMAGRAWGAGLQDSDALSLTISSVVALWLGGFLLFYGAPAFKAALFPLLFLAFCVPIPSPILSRTITFLQHHSANMSYVILKLTGMPIFREGYVFRLPNFAIEVAPECSGIRAGISLFISCLLAGHLFLKSMWRRAILVIVGIPIVIFKNALRISTLSYLAVHIDHRILESRLHREGGIPFFVLGLLLLYPLLAVLVRSEGKKAATAANNWGIPPTPKVQPERN